MIIEVPTTSLRITPDRVFLKKWIEEKGDSIFLHPNYLYLRGDFKPMQEWMRRRKLPYDYISSRLMAVLESIIEEGQLEPILIYRDMRINTGHKRASCFAYLGIPKIKVQLVPDTTKL